MTLPRLLVLGDDYMPVDVFQRAFHSLEGRLDTEYAQLKVSPDFTPRTESDGRIREFFGDPAQVTDLLDQPAVIALHGAAITAEVMDAAGAALHLIACARGGPVNVDLGAATERGIPVVITPGKNADAVADLTIAFVLFLGRRLGQAIQGVQKAGGITDPTFEGARYLGDEVAGKTLGLIGVGNVGRLVAKRALALGLSVMASDPYVPTDGAPEGVELVDLPELLGRSDIVSLHARANADNTHLLGAPEFAQMREGAFLINTARESLVDEQALAEALDHGHIAGAALDVIEPVTGRHPLVDRADVVVTPHIGGATQETLTRGADMLADEITRVLAGESPRHLANTVQLRPIGSSR